MSESGHSQPGMYGQGRRRRRRRGDRDAGPPGQNLSGPSRDREYQPRERRVHTHNVTHTDAVYVVFTARLTILLLISTSFFFFFFFFFIFFTYLSVQDGSEDPPGPLIQKTPIILAKPPGERVS